METNANTVKKGTIKQSVQSFGLRRLFDYINSNPEKNIPLLLKYLRKLDKNESLKKQIESIHQSFQDKNGNWHQLIMKLFTEIDPKVRRTIFENFVINATVKGGKIRNELKEQHHCNIPFAILMDPTSACNLHCIGCWAAGYHNKQKLSLETWNSIIEQGKSMGVHWFIYSGGEPLIRKKEIIKMCEKHSDCMFLSFTNGNLIDEKFADEMLQVKNFIPAISIEGYAEETDSRRGEGCYAAVVRAMKILKERKLLFGISCCYTSKNVDVIGSEAYFDDMINKGAMFAWFFTYIPIGVDAATDLIARPEQRAFMYRQIRQFRSTKPIFTIDFWNDGEYSKGCLAGGRQYLHINANGDIEPCAFIHYSDSNIKDKTILEACKSPLFMQYYNNQPFNQNMLRPCPLLDNPHRLIDMVEKSCAKSTDMQHPENVRQLCGKCFHVAQEWSIIAYELWGESHPEEQFTIVQN